MYQWYLIMLMVVEVWNRKQIDINIVFTLACAHRNVIVITWQVADRLLKEFDMISAS